MSLGIRTLMIAFALGLVLTTGLIVGVMSIATGERAIDDTKATGQEGLTHCFSAGESGLERCFSTGQRDVEIVTGRLLKSMLGTLASEFRDYMRTPVLIVQDLVVWISMMDPADVYDVPWVRKHVFSLLRSKIKMAQPLGVTQVMVNFLPGVDPLGRAGPGTAGVCAFQLQYLGEMVTSFQAIEMRVCDGTNDTTCDRQQGFNQSYVWNAQMNETDGTPQYLPHMRHLCGVYEQDRDLLEPHDGLMPDCPYGVDNNMPELDSITKRTMTGALMGSPDMVDDIGPRWSPFIPLGWHLSSYVYSSWTHPGYSNLLYRNKEPRGGYFMVAVNGVMLSVIMKRMLETLPYTGMRLYAVQRHPWDHSDTTILVGASEGEDHGAKMNEGVGNLGFVATALRVDASDNPTIAQHGAHALAAAGGYESLVAHGDAEPLRRWRFTGAEQEHGYWEKKHGLAVNEDKWTKLVSGGELDQFTQWETKLSADKKAQMRARMEKELALWGKPASSSDGVLYWTTVMPVGDEYGFLWYMVLMVPRDVIMEQIDAARLELQADIDATQLQVQATIQDDYKATDQTVEDSFTIMWIVIVVVTVILMATAVFFATSLTRPLHALDEEMRKAAVMKLEDVNTDKSALSKMSEVRSMQKSFFRMIKNLKEFRQFMPQSLLLDQDDQEEDDQEGEAAAQSNDRTQKSTQRSQSQRHTQASGKSRSHVGKSMASSIQSSKSAAMKRYLKNITGEGIKKKKVSFVVVNAVGMHEWAAKLSDAAVAERHSKMLDVVLPVGEQAKGVLDTFSGDRVLFTYNAVRQMGSHKNAAGETLRLVKDAFASLRNTDQSSVDALDNSAACTTGDAKVGNMGGHGMKKFTFLSNQLTFAYALERLAKHLVVTSVLEAKFAEELEGNFYTRTVDVVRFPKLKSKKQDIVIKELLGAKAVSEDEWMYQLEEGAKADPNEPWNTAVQKLIDNDAQGAAAAFQDASFGKGVSEIVADRFRAEALAGQLVPRDLLFH